MIVLVPNLLGAYFGRLHYAKIAGWIAPIVTVASSVSPVLAGLLFDIRGSYFLPFAATAVFLFFCMIVAYFARPPKNAM
jgi:MFS family permease